MNTQEYNVTSAEIGLRATNFTDDVPNVTTTAPSIAVPTGYYLLIRDAHFVLNGIVIISGLLFNSIALTVFVASRTLRQTTTGQYLTALSLADSAYLSGDLLRWLSTPSNSFTDDMKHLDLVNNYDSVCKLMYSLRYAAMLCSSSITVAITTERFLTIRFPLKIGQISTPKSTKVAIILIVIGSVALCIFPFWCLKLYPIAGRGRLVCQIDMNYIQLFKTMIWVSVRLMTLIFPGVIITFLTVWIIVLLKKRDKEQRQLQACCSSSERRNSLERQLTVMLVAVAIAFVLLRLPYTIVWDINQFKRSIWKPLDPWLSYHIYVAYKLTDILAITNYAINFFLYFLCGSVFRNKLKNLLLCRKSRNKSRISVVSETSAVTRRSSSMTYSNVKTDSANREKTILKQPCPVPQLKNEEHTFSNLQNCETKM
ncbi:hypothetical protein LSH36_602g01026 [Paralvinella palmiformis]|uniref:G-protein coupled receptors family 1 profile domain-containing protein n=1 Tax=Paralvinella palmiformis TaxID=53620 RepID=A0AAD9J4Z0_9ANNE|nr:hypothetical protein LSH36_602g01026 [Paralvinella palmiformis]